jgi:hypothetical protein
MTAVEYWSMKRKFGVTMDVSHSLVFRVKRDNTRITFTNTFSEPLTVWRKEK